MLVNIERCLVIIQRCLFLYLCLAICLSNILSRKLYKQNETLHPHYYCAGSQAAKATACRAVIRGFESLPALFSLKNNLEHLLQLLWIFVENTRNTKLSRAFCVFFFVVNKNCFICCNVAVIQYFLKYHRIWFFHMHLC